MTDNKTNTIKIATPIDPLVVNAKYFHSASLSFIATALLTNSHIKIAFVRVHPITPDTRLFYLYPKLACQKILRDYNADKIKISPKYLAQKLHEVTRLPVDSEGEIEKIVEDERKFKDKKI